MDKPNVQGYNSREMEREKDIIFDERMAIHIAIQEMKEQTRMDYDLYLESRRMRNEQIKVMLDRLRDLDHRDEIVELKYRRQFEESQKQVSESSPNEGMQNNVPKKEDGDNHLEYLRNLQKLKDEKENLKLRETREHVASSIQEELIANSYRGSSSIIPIERLEFLIVTFLRDNGESPVREIRKHVEGTVNRKWTNFGDLVRRVMGRNEKVKNSDRKGYYYLDESE